MADLQTQLDDLLTHRPHPRAPQAVTAAPAPPVAPRGPFSAFRLQDVYRANQLAARLMSADQAHRTAQVGDGEGAVKAALDEAASALGSEDPELVKHAVKLYLTHYPHGSALRIRPLEVREPQKVLPSVEMDANGEVPEAIAAGNPELRLAWYREDPKLNEHHEHWHIVYDVLGVPSPGNPIGGQIKDRQGELFLYMHRQMVARYTTERLALGMDPPVEWFPYDEAFDPYGYDPGPYLGPYYRARGPNLAWQDIPYIPNPGQNQGMFEYVHKVATISQQQQHLWTAAQTGQFLVSDGNGKQQQVPVTINTLGATQEADIGSVEAIPYAAQENVEKWLGDASSGYYGDWHNDGHDLFAYMGIASHDNPYYQGVMADTACAVRDPIFFRWHQHIDNFYDTWQRTQPPNDFSDAPPVEIRMNLPNAPELPNRSPDIILAFENQIPPEWEGNWQAYGEQTFGGPNWDTDFSSGPHSTAELQTRMYTRTVALEPGVDDPGRSEPPHPVRYLDQEPFVYFLRVENMAQQDTAVTLRIFLVAQEAASDRRLWIEMDKFKQELKANERAVICRPASLSSVIRKPAYKPPQAEQPPDEPPADSMQQDAQLEPNYCDCGWPYNLLVPRGRPEGMGFRLLVMATDWNLDHVPEDTHCGSMSYCGARDTYPDQRAMGYPFDRPFPDAQGRSIPEVIAGQRNMASRDITIRWLRS